MCSKVLKAFPAAEQEESVGERQKNKSSKILLDYRRKKKWKAEKTKSHFVVWDVLKDGKWIRRCENISKIVAVWLISCQLSAPRKEWRKDKMRSRASSNSKREKKSELDLHRGLDLRARHHLLWVQAFPCHPDKCTADINSYRGALAKTDD